MLLCETCYHGGPLEKIFITVISQSLLYNSYIIVVKTVWYSCVLCIVRWISYKIVRFSDKSTKFGTEVEDYFTNKSGYWARAYHAPLIGSAHLTAPTKILMFNYTVNKKMTN